MAPHATAPLPHPADDWREWFLENTRSFRRTLLIRRDGARLHAGRLPGPGDLGRLAHKMAFLTISHESAFEAGLALIVGGLVARLPTPGR